MPACERMRECEPRRVEELTLQAELVRAAIDRIPGDREPNGAEMDADLVCSARLELHGEQRVAGEELDDGEMRHGLARGVRVERMAHRIAAVPADRRLDAAAAG